MIPARVLPILVALVAGAGVLTAQQTTITGRLVGHDGRPMPKAHVHLLAAQGAPPITSVEASPDGSFTFRSDRPGFLLLGFSGVNHREHTLPLIVEGGREIGLDVKLGTHSMLGELDSVRITGDFNDFDFESGIAFRKQKNGTYIAIVKSKEKKLRYQLLFSLSVDGNSYARTMNGTHSEEYEYDGGGDYRSIVSTKKGKATITFDPAKLPLTGVDAIVTYRDAGVARLAAIMARMEERQGEMIEAIRGRIRRGEDINEFSYDWSKEAARLAAEIEAERDAFVRQALLLSYVELETQGATDLDSTIARRALAEIPVTSPLWRLSPDALGAALRASGAPERYESYRWELISHHPDTSVRVKVLANTLPWLSYKDAPERFLRYYKELVERYPKADEARYAIAEYDPDRNIQVGRDVPAFSLASLDEPAATVSNESMKGKVYLIDFWATWCGPCVAEMGTLHAAYDKYRGRNFEIVSLSFDQSPNAIGAFRGDKWKMPWKHGFVEGNFKSDLAARFEVIGIPKPILIDATGKIIATERDLRGSALDRTLARVLGDGTQQ